MKTSEIIAGMGIGIAAGGAAALLGTTMGSSAKRRKAKKSMAKAYKSMQNVLGDMSYMFK